jgi:ABC-2 type transport system ATP-binding protein
MDEAEHCHRLAFIQRGEIIAMGTPEEIRRQTAPEQVLEISSSDAGKAAAALREAKSAGRIAVENIDLYGAHVHVFAMDARHQQDDIRAAIERADVRIKDIRMIEPSLEDVFIRAMG